MKRDREREEPARPAPAPRGTDTRSQGRSGSPAPGNSVPAPDTLAALQRSVGNAAVARMVQRPSVPGPAGEAPVQRVLAKGLDRGTAVVKHEDDGDRTGYTIDKFSLGSYLVAGPDSKKVRVSPVAKDWGTVEGAEESRANYLASRQKELDPAVLAAKQKQQDLNLGENYLSADYRRINPLLAAFAEVGYAPSRITAPGFSFQAKEQEVLDAWRRVAVARNYATQDTTEGWDANHLRNTYEIFARINGVWSDFDKTPANADGQVVRGDSKHVYDSFEGVLKPDEHPDGGYVTINKTVEWPAILSTTFGDPLTHTYVAGKEVVWEFGLPDEHQGRSLGKNNASEQEMTFPVGTRIDIKRILVRKGDFASEMEAKYGKSATVIVFADILGRDTP
ncbi:hypothetical protein ABZ957_01235 [Streptomyces sp. NPDC046316]|uniref:hypothetical protein n=1 Tax=Streptomyces sp. NPDC046316 TaxID=3154494 RepID=UPI0033E2E3BE